jgi:hypothetical protein
MFVLSQAYCSRLAALSKVCRLLCMYPHSCVLPVILPLPLLSTNNVVCQVVAVLTRQGHRGAELDSLMGLASLDDDAGRGLLSQLSQGDAAALLDTLTETLAEVRDGA